MIQTWGVASLFWSHNFPKTEIGILVVQMSLVLSFQPQYKQIKAAITKLEHLSFPSFWFPLKLNSSRCMVPPKIQWVWLLSPAGEYT